MWRDDGAAIARQTDRLRTLASMCAKAQDFVVSNATTHGFCLRLGRTLSAMCARLGSRPDRCQPVDAVIRERRRKKVAFESIKSVGNMERFHSLIEKREGPEPGSLTTDLALRRTKSYVILRCFSG